ncbi:phosphotyrosine protein phosphatase [Streptomyces sp. ISL-44]|nr:phosphotyrosine protein phosphatase [Streptomyces sp. ISL-44]
MQYPCHGGQGEHGDGGQGGYSEGTDRGECPQPAEEGQDRADAARRAGQDGEREVAPHIAQALTEAGTDLTDAYPKPLTEEVIQAADIVITMGCGDACPYFPGKTYLDWQLEDPAGQGVEAVRPIRDEIKGLIEGLIAEIDAKKQG